jgi:hypothetical protein
MKIKKCTKHPSIILATDLNQVYIHDDFDKNLV